MDDDVGVDLTALAAMETEHLVTLAVTHVDDDEDSRALSAIENGHLVILAITDGTNDDGGEVESGFKGRDAALAAAVVEPFLDISVW